VTRRAAGAWCAGLVLLAACAAGPRDPVPDVAPDRESFDVIRIAGAPVLADRLLPDLVRAYLTEQDGDELASPGRDGPRRITGAVDGRRVVVEIRSTGTFAADLARPTDPTLIVAGHRPPASPAPDDVVVARDAVVAVVPDDSSLQPLAVTVLGDLLTCRVRSWPEGSGGTGPVTVFVPDDVAGDDVVTRELLGGAALCDAVRRAPDGPELAEAVATTPGSVGLLGSAAADEPGVAPLGLLDAAGLALDTSAPAIGRGESPLSRSLTLRPPTLLSPGVAAFLDFVRSPRARDVVGAAGFAPPETVDEPAAPCLDGPVCEFRLGFQVVDYAVRFDSGATVPIDEDVALDTLVERLAALVPGLPPGTRIRLAGFADDRGTAEDNQRLSDERAERVADGLRNRLGLDRPDDRVTVEPRGFGERPATSSNDSDAEQQRNRRVETYVRAP
jgi:outer membrane protein OmpA-like peptidoglycan-associated protein